MVVSSVRSDMYNHATSPPIFTEAQRECSLHFGSSRKEKEHIKLVGQCIPSPCEGRQRPSLEPTFYGLLRNFTFCQTLRGHVLNYCTVSRTCNPSPTAVGMFLSRGRGWQSHGSQNQGLMGNWGYKNGDCSQSSSMIKLLVA